MKIQIDNLSHLYDSKTIHEFYGIKDCSFEIKRDGVTAFIGHNGSGKTTLIKHFNALLFPTSGSVTVDDKIIIPRKKRKGRIKNINDYRKNVGFTFQFPEEQIFAETVEEEVTFGLKALNLSTDNLDQKIDKYLRMVGLDSSFRKINPFELSGGQKRRIALASILIMEQKLLILDEPTASLDTKASKELFKIILDLAKQGIKIIIVTHELKNVLEFADEVVIFSESKFVTQGDPIDVLYDIELLNKFKLEPPKIVELTKALEKKKILISPSRTIDEFINKFTKGAKHE